MNLIKYILLHSFVYGIPMKAPSKNMPKYCIDCKYFVIRNVYDNYDNSIICEASYCSKFVTKNLVSGDLKEELAIKCRNNEKMCGKDATFFTSKYTSGTNENHIPYRTIIDDQIIVKNNTNICMDCKHGVSNVVPNDPFEERDPFDSNYRCNKFVTTDIISGKEENKLAIICRNNEKLCGIDARFFIKK